MKSFVWREFLSSKGEEYEEIEDGSELKLGDAPMAPSLNIKNYLESKLGDAQGIPSSSSTIIRSSSLNFIFIALHIMCYAWSVFLLSICLFAGHIFDWILALFVWERDTLCFFVWILLCFAYILLSILSYCLFSSNVTSQDFQIFKNLERSKIYVV